MILFLSIKESADLRPLVLGVADELSRRPLEEPEDEEFLDCSLLLLVLLTCSLWLKPFLLPFLGEDIGGSAFVDRLRLLGDGGGAVPVKGP